MLSSKKNTLWDLKYSQESCASLVNELIFLFEGKLLQHTLNNNNAFWLELSNAFDCVSQKDNILLIVDWVIRASKREIKISRVTYILIKNFIISLKKYTFRDFYIELEVFFVIFQ
jgi:hypothetical protein